MANKKKKNTVYTLAGKIGDIFLIPILLLALVVTLVIFTQNQSNKVPSFFGLSVVRVLSGSMENSGFRVGDSVFVTKTDTNSLWVGDIIAFYQYQDSADNIFEKIELDSVDDSVEITLEEPEGRREMSDITGGSYRVVFHEIVGVLMDHTGARYFRTKGSSNASADSILIRDDFVVGKYLNTPVWLRNVLRWVSSSTGMICLVCLPLGIMIILQSLALIEQINFMYVEKKLMNGVMHWQDREAQRLIKTGEMEIVCRIVMFPKVPEDEREDAFDEVWRFGDNPTESQKDLLHLAKLSYNILDSKSQKIYYEFWKQNLKFKSDIKVIDEQLKILSLNEYINKEKTSKKI